MKFRIGQGFDTHKFEKGRHLILGGINIPYEYGLAGHSDADVLIHAVIDAILGALSLGDIGKWFPDTDQSFKNIDSMVLLRKVLSNSQVKTWSLNNLDATIIAQKPKLTKFTNQIQHNIAEAFNTSPNKISIKAKTTEGMGFCGREEGIAVLTNILLTSNDS